MCISRSEKIVLSLVVFAWVSLAGGAGVPVADAAPVAASDAAPVRQPPAIPWDQMTSLQRHVAFFDWDGDGFITWAEDYAGLRALGIDPGSATVFATIIQSALATPTRGFPSLTIDVRAIASALHGSDTQIWDSAGHVVPEQFERWWATWDRNGDGGLDPLELTARTITESDLWDLFGIAATSGEFGLLYVVAAEDGRISHERMLEFYDGSLFYELAAEREGAWPWSWWWS
jgi:peroxygenase